MKRATAQYRKKVYVGRSKRRGTRPPSFEEALEDAYKQAKAAREPGPYRVLDTWVDGDNPLGEYIVSVETQT
jgi:hypothetical protein